MSLDRHGCPARPSPDRAVPAAPSGAETLEGDGPPGRLVVLEFPDLAAARRFYESPEYRAIIGIRHRAATSRLVLVEGHAPGG